MTVIKQLLMILVIGLMVCCGIAQADLIQQSTTYTRTVLMTSSTDHITGATGLTLTVTESKSGAAFAASAATVTEVANGWYKIALTVGDTATLGAFNMHCTATGADPTDTADQIVAFNPNDAAALGLTSFGTLLTRIPNTLLFDGGGYLKSSVWAFNTGVQAPSGYLTNEYASIANTLLGTTLYGGLTFKQIEAINFALQMDATRTWNATTHTSVYTWYVRTGINSIDQTKPLLTKTTVYDSTNTQIVTQSTAIVTGNLP